MDLTHYDTEPITLNREHTYVQEKMRSWVDKPRGLWVSVDGEDDWKSWCENESFDLDGLKHAHRVVLTEDANVLHIADAQQFLGFVEQYSVPDPTWEERLNIPNYDYVAIDWIKVADEYDGIIIAPYRWEFRLSFMWYYGWDCASGCIWNLKVIKDFELYELQEKEA
jgi:hypothetical protein